MRVTQVEIINSGVTFDIQNRINKALLQFYKQFKSFQLVDIKYQYALSDRNHMNSAMIIYTVEQE